MLIEILKKMTRFGKPRNKADISRFLEDPVARITMWTPAAAGGANFCTRKLSEVAPSRIEFRASLGMKVFCMVFILIGVGVIASISFALVSGEGAGLDKGTIIIGVGFGLVFAIAGACLYYFTTLPVVFDKHSGHFWKGKNDPDWVRNKDSIKTWARLDQIHALQLISEYCVDQKKSYYSYELNLVLEDGKRINVVDHGGLEKIRNDANTLSHFLEKPVWDAT